MKLWFGLRLPNLSFDALLLEDVTLNVVVIEKQQVIWVSDIAAEAGAEAGMDITTAQLLSNCVYLERDRLREQEYLSRLCADLYCFTPHLETHTCKAHPFAGLLLEVSSCLSLFGGCKSLQQQISEYLQERNIVVVMGIAHTAPGAWLLTFDELDYTGAEVRADFITHLKQLPIELIVDYPKEVDGLAKTGFNTLGDLAYQIERQTISGIKKRFGHGFTDYLCSVFGIDMDFNQGSLFSPPVSSFTPIEVFLKSTEFEYPTTSTALMEWPIQTLLQQLSDFLRRRQLAAQYIEWELSDIHKAKEVIKVFADSPQVHWQLFYDLTMIQLEHREFNFEVDSLALSCKQTLQITSSSNILFLDKVKPMSDYDKDFALTAAKLKARLGNDAVYKLSYRNVLAPELSQKMLPLNESASCSLPPELEDALRPTWLMPSPVPIEERSRGLYWRGYLNIIMGPERIQGDWIDVPLSRDYYVAVRHDHVRLWIFKDLSRQDWFVHGIFG